VFSLLSTCTPPSFCPPCIMSRDLTHHKVSKACADAIAVCAKMIRRLDSGVALTVISGIRMLRVCQPLTWRQVDDIKETKRAFERQQLLLYRSLSSQAMVCSLSWGSTCCLSRHSSRFVIPLSGWCLSAFGPTAHTPRLQRPSQRRTFSRQPKALKYRNSCSYLNKK